MNCARARPRWGSWAPTCRRWRRSPTIGSRRRGCSGAYIPAGTFELLGDRPVAGRTFHRDEDRPGGPQVVVLGNEIWRSRFAGDASIVGQSIRINGIPTTVIGVMPRGFMFPSNADLWRPMANLPAAVRESPTDRRLAVFGRMTAAATLDGARAELAALDIDATQGTRGAGPRARLEAVPINEQLNPSVWQRTWLAFITAGVLVLLVACANVANLLLMRAATRGREIAIRTSIGATRWRVVRQLLAESATLAALAGAAGLFIAWAGLRALSGLLPPEAMPYWMAFTMNGRVLAVTTAVCLGCVFVCGLPSALHLSRVDVLGAITADSPASMARPARRWIGVAPDRRVRGHAGARVAGRHGGASGCRHPETGVPDRHRGIAHDVGEPAGRLVPDARVAAGVRRPAGGAGRRWQRRADCSGHGAALRRRTAGAVGGGGTPAGGEPAACLHRVGERSAIST